MAQNGSGREQWLYLQAELMQNSIVNVNQAMSCTPSLYFGTRRCTYSDVISIVTTVKPFHSLQTSRKIPPQPPIVKVPQDLHNIFYESPLQNNTTLELDNHQRHAKALHHEKSTFMSKLHNRRSQRYEIEVNAAVNLQRMYRGYVLRKKIISLKKTLRIRTRIRRCMHRIARDTAWILDEKYIILRRKKLEIQAAKTIQHAVRKNFAYSVLLKQQKMELVERYHTNACIIQTYIRKKLAQTYVQKVRQRHYDALVVRGAIVAQKLTRCYQQRRTFISTKVATEHLSACKIQQFFLMYLSKKQLLQEKRKNLHIIQQIAVVNIQKYIRGFIARKNVLKLRQHEYLQIRSACSVTLQRVYRGYLSRVFVSSRRYMATELRRYMATLTLQRFFRRCIIKVLYYPDFVQEIKDNIFLQARKGNKDRVIDLLYESGLLGDVPINPNDTDHNGNTILHICCRFGHLKLVVSLLNNEEIAIDINTPNAITQETPIEVAVQYKHPNIAECLLRNNAIIQNTGHTLLHAAARQGMHSTVQRLIVSYALSVNYQDQMHRTALHEAIFSSDLKTIEECIQHCPTSALNYQDDMGNTALHYACLMKNKSALQLLLAQNVEIGLVNLQNLTAWRIANSNGFEDGASTIRACWTESDLNEEESFNLSESIALTPEIVQSEFINKALAYCTDSSNTNTSNIVLRKYIQSLIDIGFNIDAVDTNDQYSLVMKACAIGHFQLVQVCIQLKAHLEIENNTKQTALLLAAKNESLVQYLLHHKANYNQMDFNNRCIFHEAAVYGYTFLNLIAKQNINITKLKDSTGVTPLHDAAAQNHAHLLQVFSHFKSSDFSCLDNWFRNALHYAAMKGAISALRFLLEFDSTIILKKDIFGRTALFDAVTNGHIDCIELMCQFKASLQEVDKNGSSLLHTSIANRQYAVTEYLVQKGVNVFSVEALAQDTPLHIASKIGNDQDVDKVLQLIGLNDELKEQILNLYNENHDNAIQTAKRHNMQTVLDVYTKYGFQVY